MEELNRLEHADKLAMWGTITNLLASSADVCDNANRGDMVDMLADSFDLMEKEEDEVRRFFDCYQFAFRMYFRVKKMDMTIPLNKVTKDDDTYTVQNYDYKMFLWARRRGLTDQLDNYNIVVEASKLTPAEKLRFEKNLN